MATQIDDGGRVFTLGHVFHRAFGVMGGQAVTVFGLSFLLYAVPQAIWSYILPIFMVGVTPGNMSALWGLSLIGGLITLAFTFVVEGALVRIVVAYGEGRSIPIGEGLGTGVAMALPLIGLTILAYLAIMVGLVLLVIPGIMIGVMWCVAGPALVDERTGVIGAFGRSSYLTKGARWKIFGLLLLLFVIMYVGVILLTLLTFAVGAMNPTVMAMAGRSPSAIVTLFSLFFNTVLIGFWATMLTSLFIELRNWKEGPGSGNLAEVFS